ncbi:MAG: hypothetical protein OXU50_08370 [Gammaproteobacteria bacterium]|nr:hypothetical protein [Gammaproteobacteria bacterium]
MNKLSKIYRSKEPALLCAEKRLKSILKSVVNEIEDKRLVRATVTEVRRKRSKSIQQKAKKEGWDTSEALSLCKDLVGGRVVCNNIEDVRRFAELLKGKLCDDYGVKDYMDKPHENGYRALHINWWMDVGESLSPDIVSCEVQIRTRLQDAWAELSHDDTYKQAHLLPDGLRARTKDLAEILAAADRIASDIRLDVTKKVAPPKDCPDMSQVSDEGLAYCFKEVFGKSPYDYAIRMAHNLCGRLQITTLKDFLDVLNQEKFRGEINTAYRSIINASIENEMIFLAALHAAAKDEAAAIRWVRKKAHQERREIEQIAIHEALSSLPATCEEFITSLESPHGEAEANIEEWAETFGAMKECFCGNQIVQPDTFAEAAMNHYRISEEDEVDVRERIESAVHGSGVDIGNWDEDGTLCAFHRNWRHE